MIKKQFNIAITGKKPLLHYHYRQQENSLIKINKCSNATLAIRERNVLIIENALQIINKVK